MTAIAFDPAALPFAERIHWQTRKDWRAGRVTHSSLIVVLALWGFGILWLMIIGTLATINRDKVAAAFASDWGEAAGVLAAFGMGILVILLAIAATVSWSRNGTSVLRLGTLPAFTGESFEGLVEAGQIIAGRHSFEIALTCERVTSVRRRKQGSSRSTHDHFRREQLGKVTKKINAVPSPAASGTYAVPVAIGIPSYCPGSLHEEDGTGIQWTLHIQSADGQSPVFGAAFEVPVYRREDLEAR